MHKFLFYNKVYYIRPHVLSTMCSSSGSQIILHSIWYHHTLYVAVRCTGWESPGFILTSIFRTKETAFFFCCDSDWCDQHWWKVLQ